MILFIKEIVSKLLRYLMNLLEATRSFIFKI